MNKSTQAERPGFPVERLVGRGAWWRVEVTTHDGQLVVIEPEMLAGRGDMTDAEMEIVRNAGWHLLSFVGDGTPKPCFYCGGSGEIETDNNGPIGKCPVCTPNAQVKRRAKPVRLNALLGGTRAPLCF